MLFIKGSEKEKKDGSRTRFIMTTTASERRYPTRNSLFEYYDLTLTSFSESYQLINKLDSYQFIIESNKIR
jgi:hypothetical protein